MVGSCKRSNECATGMICLGTGNAAALEGRELGESDLISRKRLSVSFASFLFLAKRRLAWDPSCNWRIQN